jgi:hypothetical protein
LCGGIKVPNSLIIDGYFLADRLQCPDALG